MGLLHLNCFRHEREHYGGFQFVRVVKGWGGWFAFADFACQTFQSGVINQQNRKALFHLELAAGQLDWSPVSKMPIHHNQGFYPALHQTQPQVNQNSFYSPEKESESVPGKPDVFQVSPYGIGGSRMASSCSARRVASPCGRDLVGSVDKGQIRQPCSSWVPKGKFATTFLFDVRFYFRPGGYLGLVHSFPPPGL